VSAFVFYNQTIVGIVLLVSLQVLKTLPAFVIVSIVKICRVTSPKLVFLSMYDKLKLKNDATYEGIKWDFLRNYCSSLKTTNFFFLCKHPPPKKKTTPDNLRKWPKCYHTAPSPMTDYGYYLAKNHATKNVIKPKWAPGAHTQYRRTAWLSATD